MAGLHQRGVYPAPAAVIAAPLAELAPRAGGAPDDVDAVLRLFDALCEEAGDLRLAIWRLKAYTQGELAREALLTAGVRAVLDASQATDAGDAATGIELRASTLAPPYRTDCEDAQALWAQVLDTLRAQVAPTFFTAWLQPIEPLGYANLTRSTLILWARSEEGVDRIIDHADLSRLLAESLARVGSVVMQVQLVARLDPLTLARRQHRRPEEAQITWASALRELELAMTRPVFDAWLRGTQALGYDAEERLVVAVRNPYAVEWLSGRLSRVVERATQVPLVYTTLESQKERRDAHG